MDGYALVAALRRIHFKDAGTGMPNVCHECLRTWPCPTISTLNQWKPND